MHRNRLGIAAVVLLVVVNVVLIGLLMAKSRNARVDTAPSSAPTPTAVGEESDAAPADEPDHETPAPAEPTRRLIHALDGATAIRAAVGECGSPGSVEISSDGGAGWRALWNDLGPITRLAGTAPASLAIVGGGAGCASAVSLSADAGGTWVRGEGPETYWHLLPGDRATIQTPHGQVAAPCGAEPVGLATDGADRAAVLCTDGAVHASTDGGQGWVPGAEVPGAVAIGLGDDGYLLGALEPGCDGVGVVRLDGAGLLNEPEAACAPVEEAAPGEVALAASGPTVWLWAGAETRLSADGGRTW